MRLGMTAWGWVAESEDKVKDSARNRGVRPG